MALDVGVVGNTDAAAEEGADVAFEMGVKLLVMQLRPFMTQKDGWMHVEMAFAVKPIAQQRGARVVLVFSR